MKRMICAVMSLAVTVLSLAAPLTKVCASADSSAAVPAPDLAAYTACLMDAETGNIIYDKNSTLQQFPASMTKVMTALLVLENAQLSDTVVITANAANVGGSGIDVKEGELFTVEQLLYAMMLPSANDAATALGEHVGGSIEKFAIMMNERAASIGANNTRFVNACGLHNDNHYTTAQDMALIMQEAIKNETFRIIVGTVSYRIPATNMTQFTRELTNTNRMLYDTSSVMVNGVERQYIYDGMLGGKTGYTYEAERCLVTYAQREGITLIGVEMHSTYEYQFPDMISLLDYGFSNFVKTLLVKSGEVLGQTKVTKGDRGEVPVTVTEDIYGLTEKSDNPKAKDNYSYTITMNSVNAPVAAGENAGTLTLYKDTSELDTFNLVTMESVDLSVFEKFRELLSGQSPVAFVLLGCFLFICVVIYSSLARYARTSVHKTMAKNRRSRSKVIKNIMEKDYNFLEVSSGDAPEENENDLEPVEKPVEVQYEDNIAYDLIDDIMASDGLGTDDFLDAFPEVNRSALEEKRIEDIINKVKKDM